MLSQDRTYLFDCQVHVVVDDLVAVSIGQFQFFFCRLQPPADEFVAFGAAAAQAVLQLVQRTGADKNSDGVGELLRHGRAVDVDIEHDPLAGLLAGAHLASQSPVPIVFFKDLKTLDKVAVAAAAVELLGARKW